MHQGCARYLGLGADLGRSICGYLSLGNDASDGLQQGPRIGQANWFGTEQVSFRATDPLGALAEDTVWITVLRVEDQRKVTNDDAKAHCQRLGLPYLPTSANTGLNVETAFWMLSREALTIFAPSCMEQKLR